MHNRFYINVDNNCSFTSDEGTFEHDGNYIQINKIKIRKPVEGTLYSKEHDITRHVRYVYMKCGC
jgi:hypothetical protein